MSKRSQSNCDIFTPPEIADQMISYLKDYGTLLEPSCGKGDLIMNLKHENYFTIEMFDINEKYIKHCYTIFKQHENVKITVSDFLKQSFTKKYDNILMNPPYIRIQHIDPETRNYINEMYPMFSKGNFDIFVIFLYKCLSLLKDDGIMVSITPRSFLFTKTAKEFRKYCCNERFINKVIDYDDICVFPKIDVYTCITIFKRNSEQIEYYNMKNKNHYFIPYAEILDGNIFKNSKNGITLGKICHITGGIATLRDKIYIHPKKLFDECCWKRIIKISKKQFLWLIFPYDENLMVYDELYFRTKCPETYNFLSKHKDELMLRDNSRCNYPQWYSFGRTQGFGILNEDDNVIYMPMMNDSSKLKLYRGKPMLYINGLSIRMRKEHKTTYDLDIVRRTIIKNKNEIISMSSKKRNGWINISTSLLKDLSID